MVYIVNDENASRTYVCTASNAKEAVKKVWEEWYIASNPYNSHKKDLIPRKYDGATVLMTY